MCKVDLSVCNSPKGVRARSRAQLRGNSGQIDTKIRELGTRIDNHGGQRIRNVGRPLDASDASTKSYTDELNSHILFYCSCICGYVLETISRRDTY